MHEYQRASVTLGLVAQWLEQRTHNPSVVGSIPTRPTMTVFDILYITYVALTQSLFVQIFFLLMLQVIKILNDMPRKNWYNYDKETDA